MNFKSQAQKLQDFLVQLAPMFLNEIMNEYPRTIAAYPKEWIELLDGLNEQELFDVDCKRVPKSIIGTSFHFFMLTLLDLTLVKNIELGEKLQLESWAYQGIKKKKKHEINQVAPILKKLYEAKKFESVVDVGGGVGHLSRILAHYMQIPTVSLDQNKDFQKIGIARTKKFRRLPGACEIEFINHTFGEGENDDEIIKKVFNETSLGIGLHTCGPLAVIMIEKVISHQTSGILNFGCCYFKMDPEQDFPLSQFYKNNHFLKINLYGLSLATRSHAETDWETYATKKRVKYYRYGLHLLLREKFGNDYFRAVGECPIQVYSLPFSVYALEKLKELKLTHSLTSTELMDFFESPRIQSELRVMFLCNIIRWQIGRALEVFLIIDRCLYLEEKGFDVELAQYFIESLSPRNLGILALRKNDLSWH